MKVVENFPDGRQKVMLSDGRELTLSPLRPDGNRIILNSAGQNTNGWIQRLYVRSSFTYYLITEFTDGKINVYMEISEDESVNTLDKILADEVLMAEYGWLFSEGEGGSTLERLCILCPEVSLISRYLIHISKKNAQGRLGSWKTLKFALELYYDPSLRLSGENLDFWTNQVKPFFRELKIVTD